MAAIDYDFSRLTFVDYGAGKGRVLLLASEHPFAAVGGIEFAEELHDDAVMNIAQYPRSRMKCRNVECVLEDVIRSDRQRASRSRFFQSILAGGLRRGAAQPRRLLSQAAAPALSHPHRSGGDRSRR